MSHAFESPEPPDGHSLDRSTALIAALGASLLGVGLIAAVLVWTYVLKPNDGNDDIRSPDLVAKDYFDALVTDNADLALSMAITQPANPAFANAAALADSLSRASLHGISVTGSGSEGDTAYADVYYLLGDQSVQAHIDMTLQDGRWRLNQATGAIKPSAALQNLAGLTFLGQPLTGLSEIDVLPGVYSFALNNSLLTLTKPDVSVTAPGAQVDVSDLGLSLTDAAQQQLASAAQAKFDACLAEQAFQPSAGCGFGFSRTASGATSATEITWTQTAGDLSSLSFTVDPANPTKATADISVTLHADGVGDDGGRFQGDQTLTHAVADLTDPANPVLSFDRD